MAKKKNGSVCCISDGDWRAESDLRTLVEAEKIKKDKKRFAEAQAKSKRATVGGGFRRFRRIRVEVSDSPTHRAQEQNNGFQ